MLSNLNLKKIIVGMSVGIAVSSCIIAFRHQGNFEQIELLAYDSLVRLKATSNLDPRITIVAIDHNSLQKLKRDKISDATLKQILETIASYQPKVIGVDLVRNIPIQEGRDELISYINNLYQPLEAAIKPIIFPCALPSGNKPQGIAPPPVMDPDSAVGFIDLEPDSQDVFGREIIRRAFVSSIPVNTNATTVPEDQFDATSAKYLCTAPFSFSFLTALSYIQAQQMPTLTPDLTQFLDLTQITVGEIRFKSLTLKPLNQRTGGYQNLDPTVYQYLIDYDTTQPGEIIPLMKLLENQVTPQQFEDKVVLIGYTTRNSFQQTPLGAYPGVVVHGWMVSQLLSNVLEGKQQIWTWSESVEWLWILGWGTVGSIVGLRIRPVVIFASSQIIAIALLWSSCWLLFSQQGWIPLIPPLLSLTIASVVVRTLAATLDLSNIWAIGLGRTMTETIEAIKAKTPHSSAKAFFIGKSIGEGDRYLLKQLLGEGGMSKVYLALDQKLNNKKVAIKIMTSYFPAKDQDYINRFMGEIEKLCMLNHPNIIQIIEQGVTPNTPPFSGYPFYVMEYFAGKTLQELLREKQKFNPDVVIQIILQVCQGLKEAHKQGIIHRDIKPGNIFVSTGSSLGKSVKIIDFGIAKKIDQEAHQNNPPTIGFIGTYQYASPEQIRGANIDARTDIYSLGIVFYQLLTNHHPFDIQTSATPLTESPKNLREYPGCEQIPVALANIVLKCLEKSPQKRFQNIADLEKALNNLE